MRDFFRNWIKKGFFKNCGSELERKIAVASIPPMRLVIFDVDGTLTDTMAVDASLFPASIYRGLRFFRRRVGLVKLQQRHRRRDFP